MHGVFLLVDNVCMIDINVLTTCNDPKASENYFGHHRVTFKKHRCKGTNYCSHPRKYRIDVEACVPANGNTEALHTKAWMGKNKGLLKDTLGGTFEGEKMYCCHVNIQPYQRDGIIDLKGLVYR